MHPNTMYWNVLCPMNRRMWHSLWDCAKSAQWNMLRKKCGKSPEETYRILMELAKIGVCKVFHNEQGKEVFMVQIFAPGILEMMVNNKEQLEKYPQIGKAFEEYTRLRISHIAPNLPM